MLIIGGPGSGRTNSLLNLINNQADIDEIYLYAEDSYDVKYQYLINEQTWKDRWKHFNDPKAFIEYSDDMQDVYIISDEYNLDKNVKY